MRIGLSDADAADRLLAENPALCGWQGPAGCRRYARVRPRCAFERAFGL